MSEKMTLDEWQSLPKWRAGETIELGKKYQFMEPLVSGYGIGIMALKGNEQSKEGRVVSLIKIEIEENYK